MFIIIIIILLLLLLAEIGFLPGGSGYFTCTQIWKEKKVTREFKLGGLHERHVVTTWKLENHLSIRL
jgi:hypothetical protein